MPNTIQAAGEAMPSSLLAAINEYRNQLAAFTALPDAETEAHEEEAIAATFGPAMRNLENWSEPAGSMESVAAVLELLIAENHIVNGWTNNLVQSCLQFLKGTPERSPAQRMNAMLVDVAVMLQNDEMMVEQVQVTPNGIYSQIKVPGFSDPLLDTINEYRSGKAAAEAVPSSSITMETEDAHVEATYGPSLRRLLEWGTPALTREAAIEAMNLMEEEDVFEDEIGVTMHRAVLRYLEAR